MLKIKLTRIGKRGQPHYRIVVNEAKDKRDGSYVESLGHYAPAQAPKILELDKKRYDYWISKGAQPTETVAALAKKAASKNPFPAKKQQKLSKKAKAKLAEAKPAKTEEKQTKPIEAEKTESAEVKN